jgi:antitoxin PrlF
MITSRLTSKAQTTIPQAVRKALDIKEGDELAYAIEDGRVVLTKARPERAAGRERDDPFALFDEWASDADKRAFHDL